MAILNRSEARAADVVAVMLIVAFVVGLVLLARR